MNLRIFFYLFILYFRALHAQASIEEKKLSGLSSVFSYKKWQKAASDKKKEWSDQIKKRFAVIAQSPFASETAQVRVGNTVSKQEQEAIKKRFTLVKDAIEIKVGKVASVPKIAVIASGGGVRASLATLGALSGLEEAGLLDTVLWVSTLSGSTWGLGTWIQNRILNSSLSVRQHSENFVQLIKNKSIASMNKAEANILLPILMINVAFDMPMSLIDLYGGFVANVVLGNFGQKKQVQSLSSQMKAMTKSSPIPIYTAVNGEGNSHNYWYAYTPWEISFEPTTIEGLGFSIPSWSIGRVFERGVSIDYKPEKTLGFHFGTFGSAFAADIATIIENTFLQDIDNKFVRSMINSIRERYGSVRASSARVVNFMKGVDGSPLKNEITLKLVDGGLAFNLPYPPVSGLRKDRSPDILIFVDASGSISAQGATELKKVEQYARAKGLKFPVIDYSMVAKKVISVFRDEKDSLVPIVIYMPFVKDNSLIAKFQDPAFASFKSLANFSPVTCCGTLRGMVNETYDADRATETEKLMKFNVLVSQEIIWDVIREKGGKSLM